MRRGEGRITGGLTIWVSNQGPHGFRNEVAASLRIQPEPGPDDRAGSRRRIRLQVRRLPGGLTSSCAAALLIERPVKWIETRSEHFLATNHGRNQIGEFEIGADTNGKILRSRAGSSSTAVPIRRRSVWPGVPGSCPPGPYDDPQLRLHGRGCLHQHRVNGAYRGAGRPEATFYLERMMDLIADEAGLDPLEVRRVNFIQPERVPVHDALRRALRHRRIREAAGPGAGTVRIRRAAQGAGRGPQEGRYLGIGTRLLRGDLRIWAVGELDGPGRAGRRSDDLHRHLAARSGPGNDLLPTGRRLHRRRLRQGHRPPRRHRQYRSRQRHRRKPRTGGRRRGAGGVAEQDQGQGDADRRPQAGSGGRRHRARRRQVPGQGRSGSADSACSDIAKAAYGGGMPQDIGNGLETTDFFSPDDETFPFGTHIAVVEVFPDTGEVKILRTSRLSMTAATSSARMLVTGQVHGGLAQGIGIVLWEEMHLRRSGRAADRHVQRLRGAEGAHHFPIFETHHTTTTTPINPLGAKGIGEAATIGATPAMANAVIDALELLGHHPPRHPVHPGEGLAGNPGGHRNRNRRGLVRSNRTARLHKEVGPFSISVESLRKATCSADSGIPGWQPHIIVMQPGRVSLARNTMTIDLPSLVATSLSTKTDSIVLGPIHLDVTDRERGLQFWRDLIGLNVLKVYGSVVHLGVGGVELIVLHPGAVRPLNRQPNRALSPCLASAQPFRVRPGCRPGPSRGASSVPSGSPDAPCRLCRRF